jgi:hypothetical protein
MIQNAINSAFSSAWANIVYYTSFQFVDPFWFWTLCLLGFYVLVMLVCYFFGTFWPTLRVIGGVMLVIATFGLFSYRQGEKGAREHDERNRPKPPPPDRDQGWRW